MITFRQLASEIELPLKMLRRIFDHDWLPHVRVGRRGIRFTPEHVAEIRIAVQLRAAMRGFDMTWVEIVEALASTTSRTEKDACYIVGSEHLRLVKIGTAGDLNRRLKTLQVGFPFPLRLLHTRTASPTKWFDGGAYIPSTERQMHKRFSHLRAHGEWFSVKTSLRRFLLEQAFLVARPSLIGAGIDHQLGTGLGTESRQGPETAI